MSLFDHLNDINHGKKNLMREDIEFHEKAYNAFMVNRGLSYFPDSVLYAQKMNENAHLDPCMQYEYLMHSIRKRKRFSKWHKAIKSDDLDLVCEVYACNKNRGRDILSLLKPEDIEAIKKMQFRGGS